MAEVKDPKIKLFGKTIELPETSAAAAAAAAEENVVAAQSCEAAGEDSSNQDPPCSSNSNGDAEDQESLKIHSGPKQDDVKEKDQTEQEHSETENSDEKALKKPDKILPCPRCNSMETKFCYFNNYNVNQPRHFCKNCQRYWTAGGTMRNVPVGAGRRRNKNVGPTQLRHQNVPPEALQTPRPNPNPSNPTLCESMVSVLNIADKKITSIPNKGDEPSKGETRLHEKLPNCPPYFPGATWPNYPWQVVPLYPTPPPPYWGCTIQPLQPWSVPWVIPQMPSSSGGPNSPTLGDKERQIGFVLQNNYLIRRRVINGHWWKYRKKLWKNKGFRRTQIVVEYETKSISSETAQGTKLMSFAHESRPISAIQRRLDS